MEAWIPLAIVRADVVKDQVLGGYGAVLRCLLRQMFLGPLGVGTTGVVLPLEGEATLITISFSNLLGDEGVPQQEFGLQGSVRVALLHGLQECDALQFWLGPEGEMVYRRHR